MPATCSRGAAISASEAYACPSPSTTSAPPTNTGGLAMPSSPARPSTCAAQLSAVPRPSNSGPGKPPDTAAPSWLVACLIAHARTGDDPRVSLPSLTAPPPPPPHTPPPSSPSTVASPPLCRPLRFRDPLRLEEREGGGSPPLPLSLRLLLGDAAYPERLLEGMLLTTCVTSAAAAAPPSTSASACAWRYKSAAEACWRCMPGASAALGVTRDPRAEGAARSSPAPPAAPWLGARGCWWG